MQGCEYSFMVPIVSLRLLHGVLLCQLTTGLASYCTASHARLGNPPRRYDCELLHIISRRLDHLPIRHHTHPRRMVFSKKAAHLIAVGAANAYREV